MAWCIIYFSSNFLQSILNFVNLMRQSQNKKAHDQHKAAAGGQSEGGAQEQPIYRAKCPSDGPCRDGHHKDKEHKGKHNDKGRGGGHKKDGKHHSHSHEGNPRKASERSNGRNIYEEHWSEDKVRTELNGSSGKLFKGKLKINPKRRKVPSQRRYEHINLYLSGCLCGC
jgi:hypothetical protein